MRHLLLVFLMLLMPLQSVWSAAASVCSHEQVKAGQRHFGHHDEHHADAKQVSVSQEAANAQPGDAERANALNADHHHVLSATPVPSMPFFTTPAASEQRAQTPPADPLASAIVASLERPPKATADPLRQGF